MVLPYMKTMTKSRSYNQAKLKILSDKLCDKIEYILSYFDKEYKNNSKMITMNCPIHGGDNPSAINIYPEGDSYRGNWKCRTHHCEEIFKGSILGFIRGILSNRNNGWSKSGDKTCTFQETLEFAQNLINEKLESIKVNKNHIEKSNFVNTINHISSTKQIQTDRVKREQIIKALNIPSQYFIDRGFTPEILLKYDVGDCKNPNKEMFNRAVVPVYDDDHAYMVGCTGRSIFNQCLVCGYYHNSNDSCPDDRFAWLMSKWKHNKDFKTQECLYNFWFAQEYIKKQNYAIVVESPGNVWRLEESGIHNSVAIFGSSLSDKQKMLLDMSGALSLVLIMDNDEAGKKASEQIIKKCNRTYNLYNINMSHNDVASMSTQEILSEIVPKLKELSL